MLHRGPSHAGAQLQHSGRPQLPVTPATGLTSCLPLWPPRLQPLRNAFLMSSCCRGPPAPAGAPSDIFQACHSDISFLMGCVTAELGWKAASLPVRNLCSLPSFKLMALQPAAAGLWEHRIPWNSTLTQTYTLISHRFS